MIICGNYMFECSVNKDMEKIYIIREGDNTKGSNIFMSITTCQVIEN